MFAYSAHIQTLLRGHKYALFSFRSSYLFCSHPQIFFHRFVGLEYTEPSSPVIYKNAPLSKFKLRMSSLDAVKRSIFIDYRGGRFVCLFLNATNQNLIPALLRAFSRTPTTVTDSVNNSCAVS